LTAIQKKDQLSYETKLSLDSTELNILMNVLQKNNPDCAIAELFVCRPTEANEAMYYLDGKVLHQRIIDTSSFIQNHQNRQIRA
jgi:hypothetical protein